MHISPVYARVRSAAAAAAAAAVARGTTRRGDARQDRHAKTAVIDGVFSTVGSAHLDRRSFTGNAEVDAFVRGEDFGGQMEQLFARDLAASRRIDRDDRARRGIGRRLIETFARSLEPLL